MVARFLYLSVFWLLSGAAIAQSDYLERPAVTDFIDQMQTEHAYDPQALRQLFAQTAHRADIIEKISKPAERVWTWGRYKGHLVDDARIQAGIEFGRQHWSTLLAAEQEYGVAPEIVLAILGIETRYGQITGSYPVFESLVTLGFDYPPRAKFFRSELEQFLLLAREEGKDPLTLNGSYAGAMGYGQFISSSYRHYAVDFDDDGVRDIWQNPVDAIGSIANYFRQHRWHGEHPRAIQVSLATDAQIEFGTGLKLNQTVGSLREAGVSLPESLSDLDDGLAARIYRLQYDDDTPDEYWVALEDFYVITRYNRSHLYAMAVHHIAERIAAGLAAETEQESS